MLPLMLVGHRLANQSRIDKRFKVIRIKNVIKIVCVFVVLLGVFSFQRALRSPLIVRNALVHGKY